LASEEFNPDYPLEGSPPRQTGGAGKTVARQHAVSDDSRMRCAHWTASKHATPIWATLIVGLALCLGGCASRPGIGASDDAKALLDRQPDGAFYRDGQLVLQYSVGADKAFLTAAWAVDELNPDRHNYRTAVMDLTTDAPVTPATLQRDWQPVTLLAYARWQILMNALLEQLAPANAFPAGSRYSSRNRPARCRRAGSWAFRCG
jgi:hypothetical protein